MPPKSFKPTRERKQRRRARAQKVEASTDIPTDAPQNTVISAPADSNAEILVPLTTTEKAQKRRDQLKQELTAGQPKMSAKKQKRFNKYLETKLKKEETQAIIEKLAETTVDTSLFASTRSIGTSRESKKQAIKRALLEEQAGINTEKNKEILYEERRPVDLEDIDMVATNDEPAIETGPRPEPVVSRFAIGAVVGAGLKRPLDGETGGPPIIKRIKKNRKPLIIQPMVINEPEESPSEAEMSSSEGECEEEEGSCSGDEEEEWGGILSEDDEVHDTESSGTDFEEGSGGEEEEEEEEEDTVAPLKRGQSGRANAFKEWALAQRRTVVDGEDSAIAPSNIETLIEAQSTLVYVPRSREEDMTPPPEELASSTQTERKVDCNVQYQ